MYIELLSNVYHRNLQRCYISPYQHCGIFTSRLQLILLCSQFYQNKTYQLRFRPSICSVVIIYSSLYRLSSSMAECSVSVLSFFLPSSRLCAYVTHYLSLPLHGGSCSYSFRLYSLVVLRSVFRNGIRAGEENTMNIVRSGFNKI